MIYITIDLYLYKQTCGRVDVWTCGRVDVWTCGHCMSISAAERIGRNRRYSAKHAAKHPEMRRRTARRALFKMSRNGWDPDAFDAACVAQQGRCFICGRKKKLNADHDHETGRPRKPICHRCNIWMAAIDSDLLPVLIEYRDMHMA